MGNIEDIGKNFVTVVHWIEKSEQRASKTDEEIKAHFRYFTSCKKNGLGYRQRKSFNTNLCLFPSKNFFDRTKQ